MHSGVPTDAAHWPLQRADKAKWISPFNTVQCENKLIQALRTCRDTVEEAFHVIDVNRNGASASRIQQLLIDYAVRLDLKEGMERMHAFTRDPEGKLL